MISNWSSRNGVNSGLSITQAWSGMNGLSKGWGISWTGSDGNWGLSVDCVNCWGGHMGDGSVCNSQWSVMCDNWGSDLGDSNGWSLTVNNSVESVDRVRSVSYGTDGTIGLDKRILSLDNSSITSFVVGVLVTGEGVRYGISKVVLWMGVEWLSGNGLCDNGLGDNWSCMYSLDCWGIVGDRGSVDCVGNWCILWSISPLGISWCSECLGGISWGTNGMSNRGVCVSWGSECRGMGVCWCGEGRGGSISGHWSYGVSHWGSICWSSKTNRGSISDGSSSSGAGHQR